MRLKELFLSDPYCGDGGNIQSSRYQAVLFNNLTLVRDGCDHSVVSISSRSTVRPVSDLDKVCSPSEYGGVGLLFDLRLHFLMSYSQWSEYYLNVDRGESSFVGRVSIPF